MLPLKLVLPIIIFLNVTIAYSKDLPPIFISPNPYKVNIKLHSGNIETLDMSKNNSSSSLGEILKGKNKFVIKPVWWNCKSKSVKNERWGSKSCASSNRWDRS